MNGKAVAVAKPGDENETSSSKTFNQVPPTAGSMQRLVYLDREPQLRRTPCRRTLLHEDSFPY